MLWLLIMGVTLALSLGAMGYLKSVYARTSKIPVASGLTGAQTAARILQSAGITDVEIVEGQGFLGDHYDPLNKKLVLSLENYEGSSCAQVGVAAHECGHALQHQQHYAPLQIRMSAVYATQFANSAVMWVVFALRFLSPHQQLRRHLDHHALLCSDHGLQPHHPSGRVRRQPPRQGRAPAPRHRPPRRGADAVSQTLNAAGLTYVAAFLSSLLQFLYYFTMLRNSRN